MVNKKNNFVLAVFFILIFSGIVSAVADVKVNWFGTSPLDWSSYGTYASDDNPERGFTTDGTLNFIVCDEGSSYANNEGKFGRYVDLNPNSGSTFYGHWVAGKCKGASHGAGRHLEHATHTPLSSDLGLMGYATVSCVDNDNDGQVPSSSHTVCKQVYTTDCNDNDAEIKVGGVGSCDCNAAGKKTYYFIDADKDGWGLNGGGRGGVEACSAPAGYVSNSEDCDDGDDKNFPGNTEVYDGKDNDCDNLIDEGLQCSPGTTKSCGTIVGECDIGTQTCSQSSIWGTCAGNYVGPVTEICNDNKDNDCDARTDCADTNCVGATGSSGQLCQPLGETLCSDGKDNDNDGLKDYAEDSSFCVGTYWADDSLGKDLITSVSAESGDTIYLVLAEPALTGSEVFEIYEEDASGGDDLILTSTTALNVHAAQYQKNAILAWTITQADIDKAIDSGESYPLKFYFKTKGKTSVCREGYGISTGGLEVTAFQGESEGLQGLVESQDWEFQNLRNVASCNQATTKNSCNSIFPACHWMSYQSPVLQIDWVTIQVSGGVCGDGLIDSGEECDDKNTISGDGCSSNCKIEKPIGCSKYVLCSDAKTKLECEEANSCGLGPTNVDCTAPDIECGCSWDATKNLCNSYYILSNPTTPGTCALQENEITSCESSDYYEYSTTATWTGTGTAEAAGCTGGVFGPIMCSAKTKLLLESKYGILLTILTIIGIYSFWFFRSKKKMLSKF